MAALPSLPRRRQLRLRARRQERLVRVACIAIVGGILSLGTVTAQALWHADATFTGGILLAGNLDVHCDSQPNFYYDGVAGNPGEVAWGPDAELEIELNCTFIHIGNNLQAEFAVEMPTIAQNPALTADWQVAEVGDDYVIIRIWLNYLQASLFAPGGAPDQVELGNITVTANQVRW